VTRRDFGVALLAGILVAIGGYEMHLKDLNSTLNLAGFCVEKGRILSDRELIHATLKESFVTKASLLTQTDVFFYETGRAYRSIENDVTDADVERFLDTPLGKKCCQIIPADDKKVETLDVGQFYAGRFAFHIRGRSTGRMRAYVMRELRRINNDQSLSYYQIFVPLENCGIVAKYPLINIYRGDAISTEDRQKFPFPRRLYSEDYPSIDQTMTLHKPYIEAATRRLRRLR
jgi:hypothetical protein